MFLARNPHLHKNSCQVCERAQVTHMYPHVPTDDMQFRQKVAHMVVYVARTTFDRFTSYNLEDMNERKWLRRFLFLETVAGRRCL